MPTSWRTLLSVTRLQPNSVSRVTFMSVPTPPSSMFMHCDKMSVSRCASVASASSAALVSVMQLDRSRCASRGVSCVSVARLASVSMHDAKSRCVSDDSVGAGGGGAGVSAAATLEEEELEESAAGGGVDDEHAVKEDGVAEDGVGEDDEDEEEEEEEEDDEDTNKDVAGMLMPEDDDAALEVSAGGDGEEAQ